MQSPVTYEHFLKTIENSHRPNVVWDIETGPLPEEILRDMFDESTVKLPKRPERFHTSQVNVNGLVDPGKIHAKIDRARKDRAREHKAYSAKCNALINAALEKFIEKAALSAETAEVVSIGYGCTSDDGSLMVCPDMLGTEDDQIARLQQVLRIVRSGRGKAVGHNIFGFDLKFVYRRCWLKGYPTGAMFKRGYLDDEIFECTARRWFFGDRNQYISLNPLCKLLGVKGKTEGVSGADFHRLKHEDPALACQYLCDDIRCTYEVARKLEIF